MKELEELEYGLQLDKMMFVANGVYQCDTWDVVYEVRFSRSGVDGFSKKRRKKKKKTTQHRTNTVHLNIVVYELFTKTLLYIHLTIQ
jgi:hypothetical protein